MSEPQWNRDDGLFPCRASKQDPFAEEALTHLDAMYGVACKLTRNPTEAEDLVQDAFVKAMRARAPVSRRHQPQGVAVPHPDEHVHQQVPPRRPRALGARRAGRRPAGRRLGERQHDASAPRSRDAGADAHRRGRDPARARRAAGRVPAGRHPLRRRGVLVRGDRPDHGLPDRHGDEPPAPRPQAPPADALQPCAGPGHREGRRAPRRATRSDVRAAARAKTANLAEYRARKRGAA